MLLMGCLSACFNVLMHPSCCLFVIFTAILSSYPHFFKSLASGIFSPMPSTLYRQAIAPVYTSYIMACAKKLPMLATLFFSSFKFSLSFSLFKWSRIHRVSGGDLIVLAQFRAPCDTTLIKINTCTIFPLLPASSGGPLRIFHAAKTKSRILFPVILMAYQVCLSVC